MSGLSPTSKAVTESNKSVSTREIAEHIKYFQQTHKAIVRLTAIVNKLPSNQPFVYKEYSIRRSDINKYSQAYVSQLGDLRKLFTRKKKKGNRSNNQLNSLFYVSDQIVDFYSKADLGTIDVGSKKVKLSKQLDLLTKYHMSTSGILTSLISRYIEHNGLKTPGQSGRFKPDPHMKKCFNSTEYLLCKDDLSDREIAPGTSQEKVDKIKLHIKEGNMSAFEKVEDRMDKRTQTKLYDEKTGAAFTTMMVFNNFYRVPPSLLYESERDELKMEKYVEMAKDLQEKLSSLSKKSKTAV